MRLSIDKNQLVKALTMASHAVPGKGILPILSNVKIDFNERGLEVTGSNSKITIRSTVPYKVGEKEIIHGSGFGSVLIDARILTEAVRRMEGETVSLDVIDDCIAKLNDGKSTFKLTCTKAEEYPDIDLNMSGVTFDVGCAELSDLVEQSAFAASTKDTRPSLMALNVQSADGKLTALATDGARLASKTIDIACDSRFACNIPARFLADVVKLFEGETNAKFCVEESKVTIKFGLTIVSSRLIAGDYPLNKNIIPDESRFRQYLEVNAQELLNAISRVSLLSPDKEPVVTLSMKEDEVEVSSRNDINGSASERLTIFQFTGDQFSISFNSIFMSEAIRALKCEDVTICFQGPEAPFIVRNPKDATVVEMVTPMHAY